MDSLQSVLAVLARVIAGFALAYLVPLAWALGPGEKREAWIWAAGGVATLAGGWLLALVVRRQRHELQPRDGFLLVSLVWMVLPACSAVPLLLTVPGINMADAYFETMSALTASGATALSGLDQLPVSVNVWRCFLQYIGGL